MTQEDVIEMADKADAEADKVLNMKGEYHPNWHQVRDEIFAKLVAEKEREACAEVAMTSTRRMEETEKAHYNNSADPFILERFGFDRGLIWEAQKIADAIRARGEA